MEDNNNQKPSNFDGGTKFMLPFAFGPNQERGTNIKHKYMLSCSNNSYWINFYLSGMLVKT